MKYKLLIVAIVGGLLAFSGVAYATSTLFEYQGGTGFGGVSNNVTPGAILFGNYGLSTLATSTNLTFATSTNIFSTASFLATASSTIGNGTQANGLTISGGATTTGSLAVLSSGSVAFPSIGIPTNGNIAGIYLAGVNTLALSNGVSGVSWNGTALYPNTDSLRDLGITAANRWNNLFVNHIQAYATSTIGDGTQIGGLTISGGATTTGNAYFANNVGIGTTTPSTLLSVGGNAYITGGLGVGNNVNSTAGTISFGSAAQGFLQQSAGEVLLNAAVANTGSIALRTNSGSGEQERISINNNGNIGLGTTTPWGLLSVNGNALASGVPQFVVGSSTGTDLIVTQSGNVGIGTTNPSALLDVTGNVSGAAVTNAIFGNSGGSGVNNTAATIYISANDNVARSSYLESIITGGATNGQALAFGVSANSASPVERMRITSTGLVGIGTTSPATLLSLAGSSGIFASTTATSTFFGGGINLVTAAGNTGCFAVNNVCISGGGGSGTVTSVTLASPSNSITCGGTNPITTSGTINCDLNLTNPNIWSGLQTFGNASSTLFSSTYASSTQGFFGTLTIPSLGIPAGQFAAYSPTGQLIGTTTPLLTLTGTAGQVAYFSGTNTAVGTSSIFINTTSGNIGIGSTTPGSIFSIGGSAISSMVANFGNLLSTFYSPVSIATTSPTAFTVGDGNGNYDAVFNTGATTGPIWSVAATTTTNAQILAGTQTNLFSVDQYGHLMASSTPKSPTVSSCGTGSPVLTAGSNDVTGDVTTGTSASTCTITFGQPYTVTPEVLITDSNTTAVVDISSRSTTAFTISLASALSAVNISYFVIQP